MKTYCIIKEFWKIKLKVNKADRSMYLFLRYDLIKGQWVPTSNSKVMHWHLYLCVWLNISAFTNEQVESYKLGGAFYGVSIYNFYDISKAGTVEDIDYFNQRIDLLRQPINLASVLSLILLVICWHCLWRVWLGGKLYQRESRINRKFRYFRIQTPGLSSLITYSRFYEHCKPLYGFVYYPF